MSQALKRLTELRSFNVLQEKLDQWLMCYNASTCDQNVAQACEIIELNARIQGELFKLLSLCASDGGLYGGAKAIKSRLLPLLGQGFFAHGLSSATSMNVLVDTAQKGELSGEVRMLYEKSLDKLDIDLRETEMQNEMLRAELEGAKVELERQGRASASEKMFSDGEIQDLRNRLAASELEREQLRGELARFEQTKERRTRKLKDKEDGPLTYSQELAPYRSSSVQRSPSSTMNGGHYQMCTPLLDDPGQRLHLQELIGRYNDLFSGARVMGMNILREFCEDHENNQRIIFTAVMECFSTVKSALRAHKASLRTQLARSHKGPGTLEEAVVAHLRTGNECPDHASLGRMAARGLSRQRGDLALPPGGQVYDALIEFFSEAVLLAWSLLSMSLPVDVAVACDAELFDEHKYRRSYDSEYNAPLVNHHIWPCLMQGSRVLVKGEACTKASAAMSQSHNGGLLRSGSRPNSRSQQWSQTSRMSNEQC